MILNRSTVVGGSLLGDVDGRILHFDGGGTAGAGLNFTVDDSTLRGNITVNAGRAALSLRNYSWLEGAALAGTSRLDHLTIADDSSGWTMKGNFRVGALRHAGMISMLAQPGNMYKNLTVEGDYASQNEWFELSTYLGDSSSSTDTLIFQRAVSSVTNLFITNTDDVGDLTTGNGIRLIEADNAAPGAFVQAKRLGLQLHMNTRFIKVSKMESWTVIGTCAQRIADPLSRLLSRPSFHPLSRPSFHPLSRRLMSCPITDRKCYWPMATPQLAFHMGTAMLGSYHSRRYSASDAQLSTDLEHGTAVWGRTFGQNFHMCLKSSAGERFAHFSKYGSAYDFKLSGIQLGRDVVHWSEQNNAANVFGVYGSVSHIDSDVSTLYEGKAGTVKMDAYSIGLYGTHRAASGGYVDMVLQGTLYERARSSASPIQ